MTYRSNLWVVNITTYSRNGSIYFNFFWFCANGQDSDCSLKFCFCKLNCKLNFKFQICKSKLENCLYFIRWRHQVTKKLRCWLSRLILKASIFKMYQVILLNHLSETIYYRNFQNRIFDRGRTKELRR